MRTLIIGYGNRSRADDAVGWFVVEQLERLRLPGVELLTSHQLEVDHAELVSQFDTVIFVDAASPESPQQIARAVVRPKYQSHAVAHYLTPADVLALSEMVFGRAPLGILFSIRGLDFNFGTTLSPETEQAARDVVRQIHTLILKLERGAETGGLTANA